jgi:aryl-alcohol dehydrogenase-like predicted oxidoreductase
MALFEDSKRAWPTPRLVLGGFHVGAIADPDLATEVVRHAVDSGFAMLDNSWDYHSGESERRVGRALAGGGYRERVLVMTKADSRSYDGLMRQFEESLGRLGLSSIDLLQLHEVIRPGDGEDAVERGALHAMAELRDQGLVSCIGVTGHKDPRFIVDIIERADAAGIRLDTAQMPINAADSNHAPSFTAIALPACLARGMDVLGMKPFAAGDLLADGSLTAPELLRWAMSQPTAAVVTGCMSIADVDQAVRARDGFAPMSDGERADLEHRAAAVLESGRAIESYKTTDRHDSTGRHPHWLD